MDPLQCRQLELHPKTLVNCLELFNIRTQVQFLRERRSMLCMQVPITIRDLFHKSARTSHQLTPHHLDSTRIRKKIKPAHRIRTQQPIRRTPIKPPLGLQLRQPRDIDPAIDDGVRDMDAARAELPRQALRDRSLGEFPRGEIGELEGPADRGRRARHEERGRVLGLRVDAGEEEGQGGLGEVEEAVAGKGGCQDRRGN